MADTQGNLENSSGTRWDTVAGENRRVYSGFLFFAKLAILLVAFVLIGMAIFLI